MYAEIRQLKESGFKPSQVARRLNLNRKTVKKYWHLEPDEYADTIARASTRSRKLAPYEEVIVGWLQEDPDMTAAQIEDWLREQYPQLVTRERTVRTYVVHIRDKHGIAKPPLHTRQYQAVDDPPMGDQMQLDFGEMKVMGAEQRKKKLYAVGAVLSHSRQKYGVWSERPLTTRTLVSMLGDCFEFYGGVPREIVIDQDKLMVVSENYGEILFTHLFEQFRQKMGFRIRLCRAGDPESKGRVEAVVKYLKFNFAHHRTFTTIADWNQLCLDWLDRTANRKQHGTTKKVPAEVFALEKQYLRPVPPLWILPTSSVTRSVRKDNTILYKSNRYSVPINTYTPGLQVQVEERDDTLVLTAVGSDRILAEHPLSAGKGELICNRNHRRDYAAKIDELYQRVLEVLGPLPHAAQFLDAIRHTKGRYVRDQYTLILQLQKDHAPETWQQAFAFCHQNQLYSAVALKDVLDHLATHPSSETISAAASGAVLPDHLRIRADVRDVRAYAQLLDGGGAS